MRPLAWLPFEVPNVDRSIPHIVGTDDGPREELLNGITFFVVPFVRGDIDVSILQRMPALQVVQTLSAGVDELSPLIPAGVTLCNGRGIHNASTAELALALILASLRELPSFVHRQTSRDWTRTFTKSLADQRVLIVGYGSIGAAIENRLRPFEVEIHRVARLPRPGVSGRGDLLRLLPHSDVVVLAVPLTSETAGMVNAEFLGAMPEGSLLVNISRGAVVDIHALLLELHARRIYAALDVVDPEPLPPDHELWGAPHILITPHVGGLTAAWRPRAESLIRRQLKNYFNGERLENIIEHGNHY